MIDLETDDGLREAFNAIASWEAPASDEGDAQQGPVLVSLSRRPRPPRRRPGLLVGAAALMIVTIGVALLFREPAEPIAAASGSWSPMETSPLEPRFDPISLWTGTELLVWGGHDAAGEELFDGAAYDPTLDRWRRIADFPFDYERRTGSSVGNDSGWYRRHGVPSAWFDGEAVFKVDTGEEPWSWDLVAYDPDADAWRILDGARFDQLPTDALEMRSGTATVQSPTGLVSVGGELVVFGWHSLRNEFGWTTFTPRTTAWSEFSGIPGSGELYGFNTINHEPVLVDGQFLTTLRSGGSADDSLPLGYTVDLSTGDITTVAAPVRAMWIELADLSTGGDVVGTTISDDLTHERFAAHLDPASGQWRLLDEPPSGPHADQGGRLVAAGAPTFYLGGFELSSGLGGFTSSSAALALDAAGDEWHRMPDAPIDLSRTGHVAIWTGDEVLIWGGATTPDGDDPRATVPLVDGAIYRFERDGP